MTQKGKIIDIGSPVKTFVNQTVKEIQDALPQGMELVSNIDFELSVINKKGGSKGLDIRVLDLTGHTEFL
jgi:hypothetical protein